VSNLKGFFKTHRLFVKMQDFQKGPARIFINKIVMIFEPPLACSGEILGEYGNSGKPMREKSGLTVEAGKAGLKF